MSDVLSTINKWVRDSIEEFPKHGEAIDINYRKTFLLNLMDDLKNQGHSKEDVSFYASKIMEKCFPSKKSAVTAKWVYKVVHSFYEVFDSIYYEDIARNLDEETEKLCKRIGVKYEKLQKKERKKNRPKTEREEALLGSLKPVKKITERGFEQKTAEPSTPSRKEITAEEQEKLDAYWREKNKEICIPQVSPEAMEFFGLDENGELI